MCKINYIVKKRKYVSEFLKLYFFQDKKMDGNPYYIYIIRNIYSIINKDPPTLIRRPRKFISVSKIAPPAEIEERDKLRKITIKIEKSIAESSIHRYITYFY